MKIFLWCMLFSSMAAQAFTLEGQGLAGWQTRELTIHFNPTNCPVNASTLDAAIDQAAALWSSVPTASLNISRSTTDSKDTPADFLNGTASEVPLILCDTTFATDLQVSADAIPAATKLGTSNPINYGAIILNAQSNAGAELSQLTSEELQVVVAHEMGHLMGLGHSASPEALMYFSVSTKSLPVLTQDDMDGLSYLYPANGNLGCSAVHEKTSLPVGVINFLGVILLGVLGCALGGRLLKSGIQI
jgi:hypothetical protein